MAQASLGRPCATTQTFETYVLQNLMEFQVYKRHELFHYVITSESICMYQCWQYSMLPAEWAKGIGRGSAALFRLDK